VQAQLYTHGEQKANVGIFMNSAVLLRAQIEQRIPFAFAAHKQPQRKFIPTGVSQIDELAGGIPLGALTEICGSRVASSGKTSLYVSLLAQATTEYEMFCALVDAGDSFDPTSAEAAGVSLARLLWVRCGKSRQRLPPLEQAFKVTDILLQSGGFGLIAVDLSSIPERVVRRVPLASWFRFSRVLEKQPTALVFLGQQSHATSCAALVLNLKTKPGVWPGNLLMQLNIEVEVVRALDRKPSGSVRPVFSLKSQWA
jgi:recombination protein RecA